ncbi:MAG: hypothetical protein NC412_00120 [Roseburia sp.]|nr:hypothetical protein [Roseburia sp.]MCM1277786.1 hypothetical protein [Robinsoniella sp.]
MEYYCLTIDKRYSEAPVIKNWTGKIQREYITEEKSYLLQQRELLEIVENKNVFFTDIVVFPFFLVSDMCKNVISLYEPKTKFKQIVLMEMKTSKYQVYHLPILKKIHGMETVRKVGKISIKESKLMVRKDDIENLGIFQVETNGKTNTIIRLDVLESMLRRGAKGIGIREIELER